MENVTQEQATETSTEVVAEATTTNHEGDTQSVTTYLDGKYESVSALEEGYRNLQSSYSKKLGAFTGSPDEYTLDEGLENNARIEALMAYGKENQLSNEALNQIIKLDIEAQEADMEAWRTEQKEALGKNADARIANVVDWAKGNLGEESIEALESMLTSAKSVEVFEQIAKLTQGTAPAPAQQSQAVDKDTVRQMRFAKDEYGNRKMSSDPAYRAKVEALEAQLFAK